MPTDDGGGAGMPPHDERIWTTLAHFSRAPLGADDAAALEQWLGDDPTRRDMVHAVQRLAAVARQRPLPQRSAAAWVRVSARMEEPRGASTTSAAAVAEPTAAAPAARAPRRAPAQRMTRAITPAPRRRRVVLSAVLALAAAMSAVVVERDRIESFVESRVAAAEPMRELATHVGERIDVRLDDGSTVALGPMSRLRYGRLAGRRTRRVELEGEAYFTVASDKAHPFDVTAGYATVQAVGTAFDVRAYPGDSVIQVLTRHGRVTLRPRAVVGRVGTVVDPGQRGTLDTMGVTVVTAADVDRMLGWLNGRLSYDLVPLDVVLRDLERRFDLQFALADSTLRGLRVTVTFDHASAADVVAQLAETLDVRYARHGRFVQLGTR